jgi:Flp pilus assembly protein TadG
MMTAVANTTVSEDIIMFNVKKFFNDDLGVAAIIFAFSIPMIIGSAGVGVDMVKAYQTKKNLSKTLDAAALAAVSTRYTGADLENFVENYVKSNFKDNSHSKIDLSSITIDEAPPGVDVTSGVRAVRIDGNATSINTFMPFFGVDNTVVASYSQAVKRLAGVEVVMVLDNSFSMSQGNRIKDLEKAAKDFVDTLDTSATKSGGEFKIGIVPYGLHVNVGPYGIGKTYNRSTKGSDKTYGDGTGFVNNPNGWDYTNSRNQKEDDPNLAWSGCVHEQDFYKTGDHKPMWDMFMYCHDPDGTRSEDGSWQCRMNWTQTKKNEEWVDKTTGGTCARTPKYDCEKTGKDGTKYIQKNGCGGKRINCEKKVLGPPKKAPRYNKVNVHEGCPSTVIQPMLSSKESSTKGHLISTIEQLKADGDATQSGNAMAWAYQMISPESPFEEGAAWNDNKWVKAILFMTDGKIETHPRGPYYKAENNNNKRDKREEERFEEMCDKAKDQGVLIYTVQFGKDGDEDLLKACATSPNAPHALKAENGAELSKSFTSIAEDLGNIFLSE